MIFKPGDYVRTLPTPKGRYRPWPMVVDGEVGIVKEIDDAMIYVSFTFEFPYFKHEIEQALFISEDNILPEDF